MKNCLIFIFFFYLSLLSPLFKAFAIEDPIGVANNRFGVHILFTEELEDASRFVNSNGGKWGYVTIPIQTGDKDLRKWQKFMDDSKKYQVIPLIRLATENYYFDTTVWRKPTDEDIVDFANFLNSLNWPTKNRYVIVFNEVNRGDEWGGAASPNEYAEILDFAADTFRSKNSDFFIISSGMDNAAATSDSSINQYQFFANMENHIPGIFGKIDGFASHSYPNPAFSQPPLRQTQMSIASFRYEKRLLEQFAQKKLPVFITETGWSSQEVNPLIIASYFETAFLDVWNHEDIVAITPFLLKAGPPFSQFSFLQEDGNPNPSYKAIEKLAKIKGQPALSQPILTQANITSPLITKDFNKEKGVKDQETITIPPQVKTALKWLMKIE